MVYRIVKALDAAETPWREKADGFIHTIGDSVGRVLHADRRFFEEIYYPMGGAPRVLDALSRATFRRVLAKRATEMLEAVHLMAIYHFHLTHIAAEEYSYALSKETGGTAVGPVFGLKPSRLFVEDIKLWKKADNVKDKTKIISKNKLKKRVHVSMEYKIRSSTLVIESWNKSRPSIAYAYAAASISTGNDRTLLHELIASKSTYKLHRDLMKEWCGRARYVVDSVVAHCSPERGNLERGENPFDFSSRVLPIEPIEFQPPALFALSSEKLIDNYDHQKHLNAQKRRSKTNKPIP